MSDGRSLRPEAFEWPCPWGPVVRGIQWGHSGDHALLLHEPGADIDAWGALPAQLEQSLNVEVVAIDLPGHGLSDDPWQGGRLPGLMRSMLARQPATRRRFVVAAGACALPALEIAAELDLAGLVCLSPANQSEGAVPGRSPRTPKLFVAGAMAGNDLRTARKLAAATGGWGLVTSVPVGERGTALLRSAWGVRVIEETVDFFRDCLRPRRRVRSVPPRPDAAVSG